LNLPFNERENSTMKKLLSFQMLVIINIICLKELLPASRKGTNSGYKLVRIEWKKQLKL